MRFLVTAEASPEAGAALDSRPGGPGPFFALVAERFHPEAFYVAADRRAAVWVMVLPDAAAVAELFHLMQHHVGARPTLQPILTAAEAMEAVPAAIRKARTA